jgi:hypothetical protein
VKKTRHIKNLERGRVSIQNERAPGSIVEPSFCGLLRQPNGANSDASFAIPM